MRLGRIAQPPTFISTQRLSHLLLLSAGPCPHYHWDQIQYIAVAFPSVFRQIPHLNLLNPHLKPEMKISQKNDFDWFSFGDFFSLGQKKWTSSLLKTHPDHRYVYTACMSNYVKCIWLYNVHMCILLILLYAIILTDFIPLPPPIRPTKTTPPDTPNPPFLPGRWSREPETAEATTGSGVTNHQWLKLMDLTQLR